MPKQVAMQRFMSIKWKSAFTLISLLTAMLFVLSWHYYQRFERHFDEYLNHQRLLYIEAMENTIHRSGESVQRIIKSLIISPDSLQSDAENSQPFQPYTTHLESQFARLLQHWEIDEAIVVDTTGKQIYSRIADSSSESWLGPWLAAYSTPQKGALQNIIPISIHCFQASCQQVFNFPLFQANERLGYILLKRPFAQRALAFSQATESQTANTHIGIVSQITSANWDFAPDAVNQPIAVSEWGGSVYGDWNNPDLVASVKSVAATHSLETLMGTTVKFEINNKHLAITALPIRGFNPEESRYLITTDVTQARQEILSQVLHEVTVIACLIMVFIAYLIVLTWQHFTRILRQIEVIPLLGDKEFKKAREIVTNNRHKGLYRDELDTLDDVMTSLTYQLESLEKAVSVRTREMERLSLFDTLTGLSNRNLFQYELQSDVQRFTQQGGVLAAVIFDLDKFKRINDTLGHQQGDLLLGKIGTRLKSATKSLGLVARMGGDEFAIILRSAKKVSHVEILCQKILELIHKPIELDGHTFVINCSLGVALATPDQNATDLIKNAEIAMYNAKENGGNNYKIFDEAMAKLAHANLSLESDLRRAFEQTEFTLYLQPKVTMDQEIDGFEALVRWDHPDRGIVPPLEFIPALENLGLINKLDNFVLDSSCRQLSVLQKHYPHVSIAVNISSAHFTDKSFVTYLKGCLAKYPINPNRLELEITETLLMENMNAGMEAILEIKALGVSIAIDDFGTGYSSLSYLKKLPVDTIKIDREFIKDIPDSESDMQISSVIIFLAKQLNFKVVAEGVETKEQLVFLKANQCDLAQGYLFSKPVPAHKAIIMLETQRGDQKVKKMG